MTRICARDECNNEVKPPKRKYCSDACQECQGKRNQRAVGREDRESKLTESLEMLGEMDTSILKEVLSERGCKIIDEGGVSDEHYDLPLSPVDGDTYRVIVYGDPHNGAIHQQPTHLKSFLEYAYNERGCTKALVVGDMTEGNGKVYRGQKYELLIHGVKAQREYAAETLPYIDGLDQYVISGNHDYSWHKEAGEDIVEDICNLRDDMTYLGYAGAYIHFDNISFYLMHPSGAPAYARSYKLQKFAEHFAPEGKPHVLLCGHYHTECHVPACRNIECFTTGAFQSQTPYLKAKGIFPNIGGLILEWSYDDKGLLAVRSEWVHYYVPLERDWGFGHSYYMGNTKTLKIKTAVK